jgi:hypothetical protein
MAAQGMIHSSILDPICRIKKSDQGRPTPPAKRGLVIHSAYYVNRQSVQYLADFLRQGTHKVTHLCVVGFFLAHPADGGLHVLRGLFANLESVSLKSCTFGNTEETLQLLAVFHINTFLTDLTMFGIRNLGGVEEANYVSALLLQNSPALKRIGIGFPLNLETIRAFLPGLHANRQLKEVDCSYCDIEDEGLGLLTDALIIGNTTLESLIVSHGRITATGLIHIIRLLESTWLKNIGIQQNDFGMYHDKEMTRRFARALSRSLVLKSIAMSTTHGPAVATIFQALETNTVLEELHLVESAKNGMNQLIQSLPRMKGLKVLDVHVQDFLHCIQDSSFLHVYQHLTKMKSSK